MKKMQENTHQIAESCEKISNGDLSVDIAPRSENDILSKSISRVINSLNEMYSEVSSLTDSAESGKLDIRGDASKYQGTFQDIVHGFNRTLDALIAPIKESSAVLKEMAKGNLKVSVNGNYKGDHAEIKDGLNFTIQTIVSYINEISEVLGAMSRGNLVVGIDREYLGDFEEIKNSINKIVGAFNEVLGEINIAADQVSNGSKQVSQGSQNLAQGATEQAGSIEELSSSITLIANHTKLNADNANLANDLAIEVKNEAIEGNTQMQDLLKSTYEINESAGNIAKIIKVIDGIAFQTNILALNAAVEAARAGQHGKGFAVVAEEVRNLSARCSEAAKETAEIIEDSIRKTEHGTSLANSTAEALNKIVVEVTKAAELVGSIASASSAQALGIAEVNQGINQLSTVTQNTSATAQESAAASQELYSQAEMLKKMVEKFNVKKLSSYQCDESRPEILYLKNNTKISVNKGYPAFDKY